MGFKPATLWQAPNVNPITRKAQSIPALNPVNKYGRVFFFSWLGFMIAFLSWYAFPPLLSDAIAMDLKLTTNEVANSNVIALTATMLVRLIAGPACDRFGPRYTFAGCLLIGAIPTFLAGTANTAAQIYALRFFIGILGGSFVPCQVWTTAFYDKNVVGTANALTAGLGNAGGGITYFVMPAVYQSLRSDGLPQHKAWRVAYIVPGILIVAIAIALVLLCPDTPTGKWSERTQAAENNLRQHAVEGQVVTVPGAVSADANEKPQSDRSASPIYGEEKKLDHTRGEFADNEVQLSEQQMLDVTRGEVIQKPTFKDSLLTILTPQVLVLGACYFCSFGTELAVNSILGNYYRAAITKPKKLNLQESGNWAAMFGLMNVVFRPLGGLVADIAFKQSGNLWSKKILVHAYGIIMGAFLLAIGLSNPHQLHTLTLLIGIGLAFFLEGANGLVFALVPHVWPAQNGVVSGFTGAMGNLGGIIFAIIFRYQYKNFARAIWIIGAICIGVHLAVCWIRPVSKKQIGGR